MADILTIKGYRVAEKLGEGGFANVYRIQKGGKVYALKIIDKQILEEQPYLSEYINAEIDFMKTIKGRNIIQFIEFFEDDYGFYIIMEHADLNLKQYMSQHQQGLTENKAIEVFAQILNGNKKGGGGGCRRDIDQPGI